MKTRLGFLSIGDALFVAYAEERGRLDELHVTCDGEKIEAIGRGGAVDLLRWLGAVLAEPT